MHGKVFRGSLTQANQGNSHYHNESEDCPNILDCEKPDFFSKAGERAPGGAWDSQRSIVVAPPSVSHG